MRWVIILLALLFNFKGYSQHANHWVFGKNIHLEFIRDSIVQHSINNANWLEGTSCYSDSLGNLKYYTFSAGTKGGGVYVLPNYELFTNGNRGFDDESVTQGSLFLKHPESQHSYFFRTNRDGPCFRSVFRDSAFIDTLTRFPFNGGEKQNAVNHRNNRDIWYSNHSTFNDSFYFFLLKKDQLLCCPVIKNSGLLYDQGQFGSSTQGQMKFSSCGSMLAEAVHALPFGVGLYHFNNEDASLDSMYIFKKRFSAPYDKRWPFGIEFSPNSKSIFLISGKNNVQEQDPIILYQLKIDSLESDLNGSTWIAIDSLPNHYAGALQLAPNGKIYVAMLFEDSLGVINNPNSYGNLVAFDYNGLALDSGSMSLFGMPNFNQSYFYRPALDFQYVEDCFNLNYSFEATDTFTANAFAWVAQSNVDTFYASGKSVDIQFSEPNGLDLSYKVQLIASNSVRSDTTSKIITIRAKLNNGFLGQDTFYCEGDSFLLHLQAPSNMHCIHWNGMEPYSNLDGDTIIGYEHFHDSIFTIDTAGVYTSKITNKTFCQAFDTITVNEYPLPTLPQLQIIDSVLYSTVKASKYYWYLNDTLYLVTSTDSIRPTNNGQYSLILESEFGCQSEMSSVLLVDFLNTAHFSPSINFSLYPNPSDGIITIEGLKSASYNYSIYSIGGKLLLSGALEYDGRAQIYTVLPSGNYILELSSKHGKGTKSFAIAR